MAARAHHVAKDRVVFAQPRNVFDERIGSVAVSVGAHVHNDELRALSPPQLLAEHLRHKALARALRCNQVTNALLHVCCAAVSLGGCQR